MLFADRLALGQPRRTADGYLAVRARAARAGIYEYRGFEIDPAGERFNAADTVRVYRPEAEVFDQQAVASFLMKPVTNDHPSKPITADNWRDHAKGVVGRALRDGEFLAFDLVIMDAATIADVEAGKRELSNGYTSELELTDGTAPDGTAYQAVQRRIRGNHVAVVTAGRAGSECRIGDAVACAPLPSAELDRMIRDERTYNGDRNGGNSLPARRETSNSQPGDARQDGGSQVATKTISCDGIPVEVTDAAEAVIRKLQGQLEDAGKARTKAETDLATLTTDKATLEAKVTTLEKQIADSKVTPAQLRDAAKAYQATADKAKALGATITDEMDEPAIKRAVVSARMGDVAKDWNDAQVDASFASLAKDAASTKPDPLRSAIAGQPVNVADAAAVRDLARNAQYA